MIQEIFTYIIVFLSVSYTIYSFVKLLVPKKTSGLHNCSSGCTGCSLKSDFLKEVTVTKIK